MNATRLNKYQQEIEIALQEAIADTDCLYNTIFKSMRYSLNAGGKRLRPVLVLEFARMFNVDSKLAMPFAVALEMIHTYSLIHDDLPCMDNDDFRRGKPTNHKVFGEACAVLAGDALLNRAFEHILNHSKVSPEKTLKAMRILASASGADGMIGGQIIDMEGEKRALDLDEITLLQTLKTGAIIKAGVEMGCVLGDADESMIRAALNYASKIGLAFQIKDDVLNVEGDAEIIGKDVGNDERSGKSTFVRLLGLDKCKKKIVELTEEAVAEVRALPDNEFASWLAYELKKKKK